MYARKVKNSDAHTDFYIFHRGRYHKVACQLTEGLNRCTTPAVLNGPAPGKGARVPRYLEDMVTASISCLDLGHRTC